MKLFYSKSFQRDFQNLPKNIQKIAEKKLELFTNTLRHPSLRIKKMERLENIWEGSITESYRFTFNKENDFCIL